MSNIFSTLGAAVKTKIDSAVSDINGDISSVQTDLASEITRAQAAEAANTASIQSNDTDISTNATAISDEASRAAAAEAANAADIVTEASTARAAEQTNATAISSEASTARAAEQTNATAISDEASRAAAAEAVNASDIASEASTARAAEQANATSISSEATTARAAESALATRATDLETQAGSLAADGTSASFSGDVSAANMVCSGNLTVQGTTTSVETVNLEVKDSIMNISKGASAGANASNDGGFVVERGSSESNVAFVWDEGADRFRAVSTSATAATSDIDAADSSMSYVEMQVSDLFLGTDNLGSISDFTGALNA